MFLNLCFTTDEIFNKRSKRSHLKKYNRNKGNYYLNKIRYNHL